jgi:hypothetical protein
MHVFSPGRRIELDYVAESISLVGGGSIDVLDILLTNHTPTQEAIDRVHLVYPHPVPARPQEKLDDARDITDYSWTWADPTSYFNRFYQTRETHLNVQNKTGFDEISIEMPNPNDITKTLNYGGYLKGRRRLTVYQVGDNDSILSEVQWDILSELRWSVFTIHFDESIEFEKARWLRLQCRNGIIHQNRIPRFEYAAKKLCGLATHTFEIAGPLDVKHRIISALKSAGAVSEGNPSYGAFREELLDLQQKLLCNGIERANTETIVKDWRINVFTDYYRKEDEPSFWGDIKPAGGLSNTITDRDGNDERVLQWKAGDLIVAPQHRGHFGARIRVHEIPLIVPFLPWIALSIGCTSLLLTCLFNADKIWKFIRRVFGLF